LEKLKIDQVLDNYKHIIDAPLGKVNGYEHVISLTHEEPKRLNAYPTSPIKADEIDRQVT